MVYAQAAKSRLILASAVGLLSAGLLVYSQTSAWHADEGFHLLAAKLINSGRAPYRDFFYQHPPLYIYLTAGWMRLCGENWRSAHVFSTLLTALCVMLTAGFVFARLDKPGWRLGGGITAALLMSLQLVMIRFGTVAQPYGLCLLLTVAAFRFAVAAVERGNKSLFLGAGLGAGAAAASSFLSAPVAPVLLLWLARHTGSERRLNRCALFLAGAAIGLAPLLTSAVRAPRQALFDTVTYQFFYRGASAPRYPRFTFDDLKVLAEWLGSPTSLLLALLAAVGLWSLTGGTEWGRRRTAEFYLCAWLVVILGGYVGILAHPSFTQYFILLIPYASILAALGAYTIGSRLWTPGQPWWPLPMVMGVLSLALAKPVYQGRGGFGTHWRDVEEIAGQVNRVTPPGGCVWVGDIVYFAAGRLPPPGLENSFGLELRLAPATAASLHVVTQSQVDAWVAERRFDTVSSCDPERIEALALPRLYVQYVKIKGCYVFWEKVTRP